MSWGAQSRSEDAKTPSVAGGRSEKPEPDPCPIQPYMDCNTGRKEILEEEIPRGDDQQP